MGAKADTAVLVTGGAGYIGSHTCKALAMQGFLPVTYDNLSFGHRWAVKWGPLIHGDLADQDLLESVLRKYKIKAVIHFAACAYVGESMQDPGKYFENNVTNTLGLLRVMRRLSIDKLVFSSSCATYGIPEQIPISESHPQVPVNPYGESKLFIERALYWYDKAHQFRSTALRYFNAAGADLQNEIGEDHDPETHLIPLVIQAALGQRPKVDIFGADYQTKDGTAVRDYIHVSDLSAAHVAALNHLIAGGPSSAINLGTGRGYSVREVISAVEEIGGCRVPVLEVPRRPGDPPALIADARLAKSLLQWAPEHSTLDVLVRTAWRWHESALLKIPEEAPTTAVRSV
jgi:UDP-arabinose 4-epimerase